MIISSVSSRKRFRESNNKENSHDSLFCSNDTSGQDEGLMSSEEVSLQLNPPYNLTPNCPVSPRVKNIREDMDALIMSRQDNPFISQQLELLSSAGDPETRTVSPITFVTQSSRDDEDETSLLTIHDLDELEQLDQANLHEHLIRSPPPQFPQKISHFVFPGPGSPVSIRTAVQASKVGGGGGGGGGNGRPPILKAASESAAMSISFHCKSRISNDSNDGDINRCGRVRRASAGGQMDTSGGQSAIELMGCCQPIMSSSSLTTCQAKKFQSMNIVSLSPKRTTNHSLVGHDSSDMDSESQEALITDLN